MRPHSRSPWLAVALLMRAGCVFSQPRVVEVSAAPQPSVKTTNTTVNTTPALAPGIKPGPSLGVTGVNVNVGVQAPAAAGAAATPAAASAQAAAAANQAAGAAAASRPAASGQPAAAASAPGKAAASAAPASPAGVLSPGAQPIALPNSRKAGQAGAQGGLKGVATQIKRGQQMEAAGADGSTGHALTRGFDAASQAAAKNFAVPGGGMSGAVSGREMQLLSRVGQKAAVADTASPHDAPALYKDALATAAQGLLDKVISVDAERAEAAKIEAAAFRKAENALPKLAKGAYKAASAGSAEEVKRAFKSLDAWERFLGSPDQPLLRGGDVFKADVSRVLAQASLPGAARDAAPRYVQVTPQGRAFLIDIGKAQSGAAAAAAPGVTLLPPLSAPLQAAGAPLEMALTAPPAVLSEGAGLLERTRVLSRTRGAGAAAQFLAAASSRTLWETLKAAVSAVAGRFFPGRVDLGEGQALASNERSLAGLASLRRARLDSERGVAARAPRGTAAVFFDLAAVNRSSVESSLALSRSAREPAQFKALLSLAEKQAAQFQALSGIGAPASAVAAMRRRGAPEDWRALTHWLERTPQAALDFIDDRMLGVLDRRRLSALGYGDLGEGPGSMARIVSRRGTAVLAAQLQGLGFETELRSAGVLVAWAQGARLDDRLETALELASGAPASAAPNEEELSRAVAQMTAGASRLQQSRREKDRLRALDPTLSGFSPAGIVRTSLGALWAERAERKVKGKTVRQYLLRDLDTREPLFALPAH